NAKVQELASRVEVVEDPELSAMMPHFRPARVIIRLKDGRKLDGETRINRGDNEDPYSKGDLRHKFLSLCLRVYPQVFCEQLHDQLMEMEELEDIRPLMASLRNQCVKEKGEG
ncbi:MAG: hypothetical protein MK441_13035, partial [SAR324 cluster bacterium]|nr:hypothetical protein [SAR324 cluster bacterium]